MQGIYTFEQKFGDHSAAMLNFNLFCLRVRFEYFQKIMKKWCLNDGNPSSRSPVMVTTQQIDVFYYKVGYYI